MVIAKGVNVGISTIYYWIHRGKLGLSKQDLLYPRKGKALKKQASTNFTKKMTPKEVAFIEKWINNYPKKCLDYKSPREDFWMANLNLKFSKMEIIFIKRFQ
ncbi:transposase [Streptococcus pneumoniae]|nr:transposase [Streptococcus pneumoniae]